MDYTDIVNSIVVLTLVYGTVMFLYGYTHMNDIVP